MKTDALEKAVDRAALSEAISRAVNAERRRCANIAESFCTPTGGAEGEGEIYIARRIAEAIRMDRVRS